MIIWANDKKQTYMSLRCLTKDNVMGVKIVMHLINVLGKYNSEKILNTISEFSKYLN